MTEKTNTRDQKTARLGVRLFSNAGLYGLGNILVKVGSLLVLPVYWGVLTPEDFGLIALFQIIVQFLASILDLGISGSIQRHYFEWKEEDRPFHLSSVWTFSFLFSALVCVLLSLSVDSIKNIFEASMTKDLIYFGIWTAFFQNFGLLPFSLCRIREQLPLFSLLSIGQFLTQTITTLIFLFGLKMGFMGYLWGTFVGSIFYGIFSLWFIIREVRFPWKWEHLRAPLAYALPTLPAAILESMGGILDRYFLQKFITLNDLGIYSLGRQFGQSYNFFVVTLKNSWVPLVYRMVSEREDAPKVISRLSTYYLIVLMVPALAIATLAPDLILWFNKPEYLEIGQYIPYFVLGYVLYGIGHIYGRGLDLAKKTQYYWVIYAGNLITNIVLLWHWAPRYGTWGAIGAFLVAGLVREGLLISLATYFYPRPTDIVSIVKTVSVNVACYFGLYFLPEFYPIVSMALKSLIIVAAVAFNIYLVFGIRAFEKALKALRRRQKKFSLSSLGDDIES